MQKQNLKIRAELAKNDILMIELAEVLQIRPDSLSHKLARPLSDKQNRIVRTAIAQIKASRKSNEE